MNDSKITTGEQLKKDIESLEFVAHPIVENFLYEESTLMLAADSGLGKSVITVQLALSLTAGLPLFGALDIPEPKNVYYLQLEGSYPKLCERMRKMSRVIPYDADRLVWDNRKMLDVMDRAYVSKIIHEMRGYLKPDVIIVDPIYKTVAGGLSAEEPSKAIIKFMDTLFEEFGCANIMVHHTHKTRYGKDGKVIDEDDPFFGSTWLKAHVDVSYHLKAIPKKDNRRLLVCKKDRDSNVVKEIPLRFDPVTFTVGIETDESNYVGHEHVKIYLQEVYKKGETTSFQDVSAECKIGDRQLRKIQMVLLQNGMLRCDKRDGRAKIWEPQPEIMGFLRINKESGSDER
jgi:hypothetical protein